jgi:hypothetical protein
MSTHIACDLDVLSAPATPDVRALPASSGTHPARAKAEAGVHELEPEADRPRTGIITASVVATLALLGVILVGLNELFRQMITREVTAKVLALPSAELRELRAQEDRKLSGYQWVSQKEGVVRIPLSRARELTLGNYRVRSASADLPPGK